MDTTTFHKTADELLQDLLDRIESSTTFEADYLNGTLDIECSDGKKYVINKHEPTKQIWFSSPFSGAAKFSFNGNEWADPKCSIFPDILEKEIKDNYSVNI